MTRARVQLAAAYILNARPYTETSLLLEALTREHGRIGLVARGARSAKSKTRALLQPLQPLLLSWIESGDLGTLTAAESAGGPLDLRGERVFYGWYLNELLLKLLERHDPHARLFDAYQSALAQLAGDNAEAALRRFERDLLSELGYGLHLPASIDPAQHYRFDFEAEPQVAPPGAQTVSGVSLLALMQDQLDTPQALSDARKILRAALNRQLGGRELETPKLLRELRSKFPLARAGESEN